MACLCFYTFFVPLKKLSDEISDIKDGFGKEQLDVDDYAETAIISRNFNELMSGMKVMDEFQTGVCIECVTRAQDTSYFHEGTRRSINSMGDELRLRCTGSSWEISQVR